MLDQGTHSCIYKGPAMCLEVGQADKTKTNKAQCLSLKGQQGRCNANDITELFCFVISMMEKTEDKATEEERRQVRTMSGKLPC